MEADIEFVAPCQREIDAYAANGVNVFAYSFDYFPKGGIVEEEKRNYELFGELPITVLRKEQTTEGSFNFYRLFIEHGRF